MRRATKCPCGSVHCKDWHVEPEAAIQGVKFTKDQAEQVAILLDTIDRASESPSAVDAFASDVFTQLSAVLAENLGARHQTMFAPNTIIPVRADLLSVAHLEIGHLRKQVRDKETQS